MGLRLAVTIIFGAVGAFVLSLNLVGEIYPAPLLSAVLVFYILLNLATWIGTRTPWTWWIASPIGAIAGLALAAVVVRSSMCLGANSGSGCAPQGALFVPEITFAVAWGCCTIAQAFVLKDDGSRVLWVIAGFVAGAALGGGMDVLSRAVPLAEPINVFAASAIAGGIWGVVMGTTAHVITRRQALRATG